MNYKKIVVLYDEASEAIYDMNKTMMQSITGLHYSLGDLDQEKTEPISVKDLLALKEAGFEPEDIIKMRAEGIL